MLHKIRVDGFNDGVNATIRIDGQKIRCRRYKIEQSVDTIPSIELDVCYEPIVETDGCVDFGNIEQLARMMSYMDFNYFCEKWHEYHDDFKNSAQTKRG